MDIHLGLSQRSIQSRVTVKTVQIVKVGKMVTRVVGKGEHKGKKFLSCSNYPECKAVEWPKPKVKATKGDGNQCPKCGQESKKMVTRKSKLGKTFLSCNTYPCL